VDYMTANSFVGILYRWFDLVFIHDPEKDFWKVGTGAKKEVKKEIKKQEKKKDASRDILEEYMRDLKAGGLMEDGDDEDDVVEEKVEEAKEEEEIEVRGTAPNGPWQKVKWFSSLWLTNRGIGWNIRAPATPASVSPNYSRSKFLLETAICVAKSYLYSDLNTFILHAVVRKRVVADGYGSFYAAPFHLQLLEGCTSALGAYHGITVTYGVAAFLAVATHISCPEDWPPIMGSFRIHGWSVRKVWGNCWHQLIRRPCAEAGTVVKNLCGFKKGGFLSRYSQVWVGFFVSALLHHSGAIGSGFRDGGRNQMLYFMLQPAAVMVEDAVMSIGKKIGVKDNSLTKAVGFLWTILWFSYTLRFMVSYYPEEWNEVNSLPSLIETVVGKDAGGLLSPLGL